MLDKLDNKTSRVRSGPSRGNAQRDLINFRDTWSLYNTKTLSGLFTHAERCYSFSLNSDKTCSDVKKKSFLYA